MPRFESRHRLAYLITTALALAAACSGPTAPSLSSNDGPSTVPAITSVPGPSVPAPAGSLAIDSFEMLEIQYQGNPGWFYAPLVHVTSSSSQSITVTRIKTRIDSPGFAWSCWTARTVAANGSRNLFATIYGDFEFTMDKPGYRVPAGTAAYADVEYVIDATGDTGMVSAGTAITPGTLPYGRVDSQGSCQVSSL